jgi:hypothetical protein
MMRKKGKGTLYPIVVRSELTDRYTSAFEGMEMETKKVSPQIEDPNLIYPGDTVISQPSCSTRS